MNFYYEKYLKYKNKYLNLKKKLEGGYYDGLDFNENGDLYTNEFTSVNSSKQVIITKENVNTIKISASSLLEYTFDSIGSNSIDTIYNVIVKLIELGADVNKIDKNAGNPLLNIFYKSKDNSCKGCFDKFKPIIILLLQKEDIDLDHVYRGPPPWTVYSFLMDHSCYFIVEFLLLDETLNQIPQNKDRLVKGLFDKINLLDKIIKSKGPLQKQAKAIKTRLESLELLRKKEKK